MNKSFKVIALVLVTVGLLTATYKAGQSSISQDSQGELRAKQELIELTQKDFEEYQNLKSLEDRYKKADEILGKIMTVFLADLGLRLGYKPVSAAELDAACGIPGLAPAPTIIPAGAIKSEAPKVAH